MGETVFLRPGTLLIVLIAVGIGFGLVNWSEGLLERTGENSEGSSQAIECSTLEAEFVGYDGNETHQSVFVQINKDAEAMAVTLTGEASNYTRVIENPGDGSISKVTAPLSTLSGAKVNVQGCSRVFRR